ncbi:MAG: hypothetical protein KGL11_07100 [Alphaproteobacteria bacterium]|nr:hypothetical protein [Alphaproteobacteria bacterium]
MAPPRGERDRAIDRRLPPQDCVPGEKWFRRAVLRAACLVLAFAAAGCGRTDFYPSSTAYYRPWTGVIQVVDRPPAQYVQLGVVVAHGGTAATEESLIEQLKERAAGMGANVIVVTQRKAPVGHNVFGMPDYEMSALAVRTVR